MAGPRHCPPRSRTTSGILSEQEEDGPSSIDSGVSVSGYMSGSESGGDHVAARQEWERQREHHRYNNWPSAKHWFAEKIDLGVDLKTIIRPHLHYLCENTDNVDKMMEIWYAKFDLTADESSHVAQDSDSYKLCGALYASAMTNNDGQRLLEAWTASDNHHIVQYLKNNMAPSFKPPAFNRQSSQATSVATQYSSCSDDDFSDEAPAKPAEMSQLMMDDKAGELKTKKGELQPPWKFFYFCVSIVTLLLLFLFVGSGLVLLSSFRIQIMTPNDPGRSYGECHWPNLKNDDTEKDGGQEEEEEDNREVFISIDSPTMKLPSSHSPNLALHLTIVNRNSDQKTDAWLALDPPVGVAGGVTTLTLLGHFGDRELDHFCRLFPYVISLYNIPLPDGADDDESWDY